METASSARSSCASRPSPPPSRARRSSASSGSASSPTRPSSAATAPTTGSPSSSASSSTTGVTLSSAPSTTPPTASRRSASSCPVDEWAGGQWSLLGCRHGRILVFSQSRNEAIVWDPATGDRRYINAPPEFHDKDKYLINGAVLCAANDEGHVHGDCHSSPFQVVLIGIHCDYRPVFASFYSSETGVWGDVISMQCRPIYSIDLPSNLIGDSLYWVFRGDVEGIPSLLCLHRA
ncbi:hypothetical protein BS78_07G121300 [Paspalum vaginatum]|nr:hypothetical protein BS78_07G121300 [Paspalum vaginatum]